MLLNCQSSSNKEIRPWQTGFCGRVRVSWASLAVPFVLATKRACKLVKQLYISRPFTSLCDILQKKNFIFCNNFELNGNESFFSFNFILWIVIYRGKQTFSSQARISSFLTMSNTFLSQTVAYQPYYLPKWDLPRVFWAINRKDGPRVENKSEAEEFKLLYAEFRLTRAKNMRR